MARIRKTDDIAFDRFWRTYPQCRRVAKLDALKAWRACNPTPEIVEQMIAALQWQTKQESWVKDGGAYVPYPATWIRAGRWLDEKPVIFPVRVSPVEYRPGWMKECADLHQSECPNFKAHELRVRRAG